MAHEIERTTVETADLTFAALTCGDGDRTALVLHGFPDAPTTFEPLLRRLAEAGFSAVAPYMRGYGETDRPPIEPGNYSPLSLGADVFSLLEALETEDPLVVGHDWGAIAATAAITTDSSRVGTCALLAVPPDFWARVDDSASQALRSWYMTEFQIPGHGEEILRRDDFALLERLWQLWSPNWSYDAEELRAVKETFATGETVEAALRYYRDMFDMMLPRRRSQLSVSGIEVPTLLVAGGSDGCIGADMFEGATDCVDARAELEVLPTAGHFLHAEQPEAVADRILAFDGG